MTKIEGPPTHLTLVPPHERSVSLGDNVRFLRERAGFETNPLAREVGIDQVSVHRIQNNQGDLLFDTAAALILGLSGSKKESYRVVMDSVPEEVRLEPQGIIFPDDTPVLEDSVSQQLQTYREIRNLSRKELASKAHINHTTIFRSERLGTRHKFQNFASLAYVLGLNKAQVVHLLETAVEERNAKRSAKTNP